MTFVIFYNSQAIYWLNCWLIILFNSLQCGYLPLNYLIFIFISVYRAPVGTITQTPFLNQVSLASIICSAFNSSFVWRHTNFVSMLSSNSFMYNRNIHAAESDLWPKYKKIQPLSEMSQLGRFTKMLLWRVWFAVKQPLLCLKCKWGGWKGWREGEDHT